MKQCLVCGDKTTYGNRTRVDVLNNQSTYICHHCLAKAGIDPDSFELAENMRIEELQELIAKRNGILDKFCATESVEGYIEFDEHNRLFQITSNKTGPLYWPTLIKTPTFFIDDISAFDVVEDGETKTRGGLGLATAGGLLFGSTGAIVGASAASRKSKQYCNSIQLIIVLKKTYRRSVTINFLDNKVGYYTPEYVEANKLAEKCLLLLQQITKIQEKEPKQEVKDTNAGFSAADELLKFKKLLDIGAITQEEFDAQKKKLLNL